MGAICRRIVYITKGMPMKKFPGWDKTDGVSVSPQEMNSAFDAVMKKSMDVAVQRRRIPLFAVIGIAAAAIIAILSPLSAWLWVSRHQTPQPVMCQATTARGEIREIVLSDGTKAILNSESVLVYPETFGRQRSVFLSGEASFDVTSDDKHPFFVKTTDVTIKVHGTRFNIDAYYDDSSVSATLLRGVITAWPEKEPDRTYTLEPNQCFLFEKSSGKVSVSPVNALESVAWEQNNLCFRSESIQSVIRTLERCYNVDIILMTDRYDKAILTASFIHGETLDELMDAICMIVPGMRYTRDGEKIYLK